LNSKKSRLKVLEDQILEGNYEIKVLKEKASLERYIAEFETVSSTIEGYAEIIEIADDEIRNEIFKELPKLIEKMKFMEMAEMFSEEADKLGVVLEINSGAGGTESQDWAEMLERMYIL
jgi:peptide chain release factor 2